MAGSWSILEKPLHHMFLTLKLGKTKYPFCISFFLQNFSQASR